MLLDSTPLTIDVPDFKDDDIKDILPGAAILEDIEKYRYVRRQLLADVARHNRDIAAIANGYTRITDYTLTDIYNLGKDLPTADTLTNPTDDELIDLGMELVKADLKEKREKMVEAQSGAPSTKLARRQAALVGVYTNLEERRERYFNNLGTNKALAMLVDNYTPKV
jgi:hypothetical protein